MGIPSQTNPDVHRYIQGVGISPKAVGIVPEGIGLLTPPYDFFDSVDDEISSHFVGFLPLVYQLPWIETGQIAGFRLQHDRNFSDVATRHPLKLRRKLKFTLASE